MFSSEFFIDTVEKEAGKKHLNVDVINNLFLGDGGNIRFIFSYGAARPDYCVEVLGYRMNDNFATLANLARAIVLDAVFHLTPGSRARIKGNPSINNVIFNPPATIVFWADGTKTVVKAINEDYDPEKGLAMAIAKKHFGNTGNYFNQIKKWTEEYEKNQQKKAYEEFCSELERASSIAAGMNIGNMFNKFFNSGETK